MLKTDRVHFERVHKFSARLFLRCHDHSVGYDTLLNNLGWSPLYRHIFVARLILIYKYVHDLRKLPTGALVRKADCNLRINPRIDHSLALIVPRCKFACSTYALSSMATFFNTLPNTIVNLPLGAFKRIVSSTIFFDRYIASCPSALAEIIEI